MRPKVVKILCSRIVITNENRAEIENFIDDIKKLNVFFEVTGSGNAHILDISADDGKLYEVCCVCIVLYSGNGGKENGHGAF